MAVQKLQRDGFVVERHGDRSSTYFVYAGHMKRVQLSPIEKALCIPCTRLDESGHVDDLVAALWELAIPGIVDSIDVSYREGDPDETMTVRSR